MGSVVSGAAGDQVGLIVGRVLQGAGAAPMLSLSLALVCNAFPSAEQPRALGIWAAVSAVALGIGPLAGGVLIEIDWRLIFWMNLPVAAIGVAITALAAPESTDPGAGTRIDWTGLAALSVGITAAVLALVQSNAWDTELTAGLALVGLLALFAFWRIERRVSNPIVDFALFRNGPYFGASAAAFALVGAYWAVMFFQPQYLQDVRGHSPIAAGLLILPITVPMIFVSPFSGRLIGRFGARRLMTAGMVFGVLGLAAADPGRRRQLPGAGPRSPTCCSGSRSGSSTRRCRPRRWRRCRGRRSGSPPGCWRWTGCWPAPSRLPPPAPSSTLSRETASSFAAAIAGSTWVAVGALRGRRRSHLDLRPRPRTARTGPGGGRRSPFGAAPAPSPPPPIPPVMPETLGARNLE